MNNVTLTGRLTRDPELRYTVQSQTAVCTLNIAVDRPVRQGEEKQADFIRVKVFGKQAENADKYLTKGRQIAIIGRIQTGNYQKDGQTIFTTDIIAERVEYLGTNNNSNTSQEQQGQVRNDIPEQIEMADAFVSVDEDIPF